MTLEQSELWASTVAFCIIFLTVLTSFLSYILFKIRKSTNDDKHLSILILFFIYFMVASTPIFHLVNLVFAPHTTINKLLEEKK